MSFFDDVEDSAPTRSAGAARRSSGGRRPPPRGADSRFLIRRTVLVVVVLVALILIVVGVHSCQVSARNSALRDYDNSVASLIQRSNQTGHALFSELSGASGSTNQTGVQTQIDQTKAQADGQLRQAGTLNVPSEAQTAQHNLLLVLRMRRDAISTIAMQIQPALSRATAGGAVATIAGQMSRLYASDVLYNDYVAPEIVSALKSASIPVGGANGQPISHGNFVPGPEWLTESYIAARLGGVATTTTTTKNRKPAPGIHGHRMVSVSVSGTVLSTVSTNTLSASPPATFSVTFANDGTDTETNVIVKVTVEGTSVSGQAIVPQTVPGHTYTAQVTLSSTPPSGSYTVKAMIERVPGETVLTHNTLTFPVTFH